MYEAARWNPDWPREPIEEVLADPIMLRYHQGWGRRGDGGVVAEVDGEPVGAAWYRLFEEEKPGYGFVDEKTPELSIAVVPLHRRKGIGEAVLRSCMVQAREEGFQALSLSVAVHNRSRMMYQKAGFERSRSPVGGAHWTMVANLYPRRARSALPPSLGRSLAHSRRSLGPCPSPLAKAAASATTFPDPPGDRLLRGR